MNLFFLRHAIAADQSEWTGSDSDRPLTKDGIRKMKKAAKGMRRLDLQVQKILTSPYRRAYDTAIIAAKELKLKKQVKVIQNLAPDGDPKAFVRYLNSSFRSWESVMLVGHEPYLSRLMSVLCAGNKEAAIEFDKGGLAKVSAASLQYGSCAQLEWLLTSKILKKLI